MTNATKILIVTLITTMCVLTGLGVWRVADLKFSELGARVSELESRPHAIPTLLLPCQGTNVVIMGSVHDGPGPLPQQQSGQVVTTRFLTSTVATVLAPLWQCPEDYTCALYEDTGSSVTRFTTNIPSGSCYYSATRNK